MELEDGPFFDFRSLLFVQFYRMMMLLLQALSALFSFCIFD
jgi:hypothetical protein